MDSDFQSLVNNLQREILDLKTGHDKKSSMKTFTASIDIPETFSFTDTTIRLYFNETDQPLLITVLGLFKDFLIFQEPTNTYIDAVLAEKEGYYSPAFTFYFMANREITSITML